MFGARNEPESAHTQHLAIIAVVVFGGGGDGGGFAAAFFQVQLNDRELM